jgi:ketosteroid isomerase-like protein
VNTEKGAEMDIETTDPAITMMEGRVRTYYALVDGNDIDGLVELFAHDAVYRRPGYPPLQGRGELERFYREERVIKSGRHTLDDVVSSRSRVAVAGTFSGTLHNGQELTLQFADFFSFGDDDTFASRDTYFFTPLV